MRAMIWSGLLVLAAAGAGAAAQDAAKPAAEAHPTDAEVAAWFKIRQTKFAELKAATPDQPAQLATLKAKTASEVAAAGPLGSVDQPPVTWSGGRTGPIVIYEDPAAPRMVVVPAGEFTMGSPDSEPGHMAAEAPRHRVRIGYPLAVSMFPIVWGEYALFVADTQRAPSGPCITIEDGTSATRPGRDWRTTGFPQTVRHPVTCVSYDDAVAYTAWLSRKTGHTYRLLSEAEYEYVERAGTTTAYWWGSDASAGCAYANGLDQDGQAARPGVAAIGCHDGYAFTAPVGTLKPNAFGLFDTAGNVASWTADCWNDGYAGAPVDGAAATRGDCKDRMLRGGSWASTSLRSASRGKDPAGYVGAHHGFRVARVL